MHTYRVVLRRASNHRQHSWCSLSYLLPKPLPLTAVFTTAVCLSKKHNIAIICQPIPAWTLLIHCNTHTDMSTVILAVRQAHEHSATCLTSPLILLSVLRVPDNHYLDVPNRGHTINILYSVILYCLPGSTVLYCSVLCFTFCCFLLTDLTVLRFVSPFFFGCLSLPSYSFTFSPPNPSPHLPSIAHPADTEPPDPARPQPSGPEL